MAEIKFEKQSSAVAGITEIRVRGVRGAYVHVGWGCPLLEVQAGGKRAVFIAEAVLKDLNLDPAGPGLRYGPGARRAYRLLTEAVCEQVMKGAEWVRTSRNGNAYADHAEHQRERAEFGLALVDLL